MPNTTPTDAIIFAVRGQAGGTRGATQDSLALGAGFGRGRVAQSVRVAASRGSSETVQLSARPGLDVVVLHMANGPSLVLHPETARDLMLAQAGGAARPASRGTSSGGGIVVPTELAWQDVAASSAPGGASRGASRGRLGQALLSGIDIVSDLLSGPAARYTAAQIAARVDQQVDPGLYLLPQQAFGQPLKGNGQKLARLSPPPAAGDPVLVLLHGTFSHTQGTFGKLWQHHPGRVHDLFAHYGQRVYGFDHPTLGESPIENALMLARALPNGTRLHLLTHSRGGLVAEVLARMCARPELDANDLAPFQDPAYHQQAQALRALGAELQGRDIRVERVVRVACPARGTLLASKRLDAYVSVLRWSLQLAAMPVSSALVDFLGEVATQRTDPTLLPGLEAMTPQSPLVQWLHDTEARGRDTLPGQLRVVAGDIQGDSLTSWIKTLLADAFYWTDNDLVVQTRSMYGGTPRATSGAQASASFVLDRGGEVTHFAYFTNPRTAEAVCSALVQDAPSGFQPIGPLSWAGSSSDGLRAAPRVAQQLPPAQRPAVIVLPGMLGSHLSVDGQRVWLGLRLIGGLGRIAYHEGATNVQADGVIGSVYGALAEYLSASHEVIEFSFDWRRPIEQEAQRLAQRLDQALAERQGSGQPVRLLAHSMGGLVARTVQLEQPEVWQRWLQRPGSRLLLLGTPNAGTFAPMQVLSGDDPLSNAIGGLGMPFQDHRFRQLIAEMPGLLQLQAGLLEPALGLQDSQRWQALAEQDMALLKEANRWHNLDVQRNVYRWGIPPQSVLDQAVALRQRLDQQRHNALPDCSDRLLMVLGQARFTPASFELDSNDGLIYLNAPDTGDGRVTQDGALLPGVKAWTVPCEHGDLPSHTDTFGAYLDLLERGDTQRLKVVAPSGAPAAPLVRSRPSRERSEPLGPPVSLPELFQSGQSAPPARAVSTLAALRVSVHNGNLRFVRAPLLVGHYGASTLTGTERVVDGFLGGAMSASLAAGLYPEAPGTHQIFLNHQQDPQRPFALPRPPYVVVAGLGEEGKLQAADLVLTVRQATMAWAQRVAETPGDGSVQFELCATLIGSGGVGVSVCDSAQALVQGVREANERLQGGGWPQIGHLRLIEIYLDRATEAWDALRLLAATAPEHYVLTPQVMAGAGALRRPLETSYRGTGHDFISAISTRDDNGEPAIMYTLDTQRARSEARVQATQTRLVTEMVQRASNEANRDPQIGRTLFQLLVPVEMEANLRGTNELLLELNDGTAPIPWELLDAPQDGRGGPTSPWAIRHKLLRKLRTVQFRGQVIDARREDAVLVIGEPLCDPTLYPPLPSARSEAEAVREALSGPEGLEPERVHALIAPDDNLGPDAAAVTNALLARPYRIVHIAGHGEPELLREGQPPQLRGVVLSDGTFLGPREVEAMRVVPELVFLNCCHLAADPQSLLKGYDRASFAAGVAKQLIRIGVRCVIAAGWAVEDHAANVFAIAFYQALMGGQRFMDAVHAARVAAYEASPQGNTWAAYQCYGDPEWVWQADNRNQSRLPPPVGQAYAGIASPVALTLALETLAVESSTQGAAASRQREKIAYLQARFGDDWGDMGAVAESFGVACAAAGDTEQAIRWYARAVAANDGSGSVKSSEQLARLRAGEAWSRVNKAQHLKAQAGAPKPVIEQARVAVLGAIHMLQALLAVAPTLERESLLGSVHQQQALIERAAGDAQAEALAIAQMAAHYQQALTLADQTGHPGFLAPALKLLAARLLAHANARTVPPLDANLVDRVREGLQRLRRDDPDFWSTVGLPELEVYEALAKGELAARLPALVLAYEDLHQRAAAPLLWVPVADQLGFVLDGWQVRRGAEAVAARSLLARLRRYAQQA